MYERLFLLIFISLFSFFYQCKTEPGSDFSKIQLASDSEVNWKNVETETVKWLSDYIKIDTVNNPDLALKTGIPTGNEIDGAKFLKQILDKEGISSEIIEFLPRRAVLYSRLKGNGTKKPVMLLHHMDVVPIEKSRWTKPPLSGLIENGKIYGRGALDDKGMGVMNLAAYILLKRNKIPLNRDVVFLASADEEAASLGVRHMIEKRKSDVDVEFILNEGSVGTIGAVKKGQILFPVQVGEKGSAWLRLEAKGVPGHGSKPPTQTLTSVQKLLRALARIEKKGTEFEVTPEVRKFFYELGKSQDFPNSFILKNIDSRLIQRLAGGLIAKSTSMNAILKNTISITRLEGSEKVNVIPTNAIAEIDCRLLPGTDPDEFTEQIRRTINDEDITVTRFFGRAASSSPSENELYLTIGASIKKFHPDAVIAPFLTPAQTDTAFFRAIGIPSYGMIPGVFTSEEIDLIHGNDEYISIENLVNGTKIIYLTIKTIVK